MDTEISGKSKQGQCPEALIGVASAGQMVELFLGKFA